MFNRNHFAIEYKQKGKDLDAAYVQLQQYRENLNNPPLLIVCDIERWIIHTNFTNTPPTVIEFRHEQLGKRAGWAFCGGFSAIRTAFTPKRTRKTSPKKSRRNLIAVVDGTLEWKNDPERVARFMTKLVFCMFVEDIGLLPKRAYDGILTEIIRSHADAARVVSRATCKNCSRRWRRRQRADGRNPLVQRIDVRGGRKRDCAAEREALNALDQASDQNWAHVEPRSSGRCSSARLTRRSGRSWARITPARRHSADCRAGADAAVPAGMGSGASRGRADARSAT